MNNLVFKNLWLDLTWQTQKVLVVLLTDDITFWLKITFACVNKYVINVDVLHIVKK